MLWGPWLTTACLEELYVLRTAQPWGWDIFLTRNSFLRQFLGYRVPQAPWLHSDRTTFTLCDLTSVDIWGSPLTPHTPPFGDLACSGQAMSSMCKGRVLEGQPFILRWSKISRGDAQKALDHLKSSDSTT